MIERIVDWVVGMLVKERVSGWNTKLGGAITILLGVSGMCIVLAQSARLAQDGHYTEAVANLNSPEMWAALLALGVTKQTLGVRVALDKQSTTTGEAKP